MSKFIVFLTIFIVSSLCVHAQLKSMKVGGGPLISTVRYNEINGITTATPSIGYSIDIIYERVSLNGIFIESGIFIENKNFSLSEYDTKVDYSLLYFNIPLHFGYKVRLYNNYLKYFAGGYFGIIGKGGDKINDHGDYSTFSYNNSVYFLDGGFSAGISYEFKNIEFSLNYQYGLMDIASQENISITNSCLKFSLRILIPMKRRYYRCYSYN